MQGAESRSVADTVLTDQTSLLPELSNAELAEFRHLLNGRIFSRLNLSPALKDAFREHYRGRSAQVLRKSVYGFIGLYFLVVLPVALSSQQQPNVQVWFHYAVLPIGAVLLVVWGASLLRQLQQYVEAVLGCSVFVCLCGTLYCAMLLDNGYFGQIAAYETIFILIVAFALLLLPCRNTIAAALAAFAVAISMAFATGVRFSWLSVLLYFWVPFLICAVNGYLLEYAARREFIQMLCHQNEKLRLLNDMAAVVNDADDVNSVLELALERVCAHTGWVAGQAMTMTGDQSVMVRHVEVGADSDRARQLRRIWLSGSTSPLVLQVVQTGKPAWRSCVDEVQGDASLPDGPRMRLAFPVKVDENVVAVLEFFSASLQKPDERLLSLLENVGHHLGRIFDRQRQQNDLRERALHDALTGLPNRAYLFDHLRLALAKAKRHKSYGFCVLYMDVDRFKWINDSLGHLSGDRLLVEFSRRLQHGVRPCDVIARLGGDEFAVLIDDILAESDALTAVQRIQQQLQQPFGVSNHEIKVGASIGVAMSRQEYNDGEEILRDADIAMYHAKQNGRGNHALFAEYMRAEAVGRLKLVTDLRRAIENGQLVLHYQPIVAMGSGQVKGFEALVRWQHPEFGLLKPENFIPLAEETGLILPLTQWVLKEACRQLQLWQQQHDTAPPYVSVNLCARYFAQADMPDQVMAIMRSHALRAGSLHLEITESQIIGNADICMKNIHRLRENNVAVYIDDFGTGYSSLNYLASFRVNALKIDRSFMAHLEENGKESLIVRAITALSRNLGLEVIAEGVETVEQLQCLQELGCQYVQGFLLSQAVDSQAAAGLIGQKLMATPS